MPPVLAGGAVSDVDEDAQPAFAAVADFNGSDEGPPLEELEAQMGGEVAARDGAAAAAPASRRAAGADEDDEAAPDKATALPELDTLVARLPAELRETLDELFRARFVSVKKLPKKVFQSASIKARSDVS